MKVISAESPEEIREARCLFREYEAFLNVDLCFQGFEEELAGLPGKYASPDGGLLLAVDEREAVIGCVALRRLEDVICEMKRLFVRPDARGSGYGSCLAEEIIKAARELDYAKMRLDTLARLTDAFRLYEALGFERVGAYYENPLEKVVYLELDLRTNLR